MSFISKLLYFVDHFNILNICSIEYDDCVLPYVCIHKFYLHLEVSSIMKLTSSGAFRTTVKFL